MMRHFLPAKVAVLQQTTRRSLHNRVRENARKPGRSENGARRDETNRAVLPARDAIRDVTDDRINWP